MGERERPAVTVAQTMRLLKGEREWWAAWEEGQRDRRTMEGFCAWAKTVPWKWFVLQTFRDSYSLRACSRVCYHSLAVSPCSPMLRVVLWAAELGPTGGRAHLHMLWSVCEINLKWFEANCARVLPTTRPFTPAWKLWKEWLWERLGKATLRPFRKEGGAEMYLSKYILKKDKLTGQELGDWGIWTF